MCRSRRAYPLWQPGPPGLAFYGSGPACLPSWLGMVNGLFQKKTKQGGWGFGISRGKVKKMKNSRGVQKRFVLNPPVCFFSGISQCRLALFHVIKSFLVNEIYHFFKAVPPNRFSFYLGSLLHITSSLCSHFRSWDYPENFGIYSKFDRNNKNWFFTFLNVYVSWIEQDQIQLFCRPEWTKGGPLENEYWQLQMQKWDS